jgi:hypothetical protein
MRREPDGVELLRRCRSVLLIDWPSREVPDSLALAGLEVTSRERDDVYFGYRTEGDEVRRSPMADPPERVDIVYAHRPIDELPEIIAQARDLGATAIWLQSGLEATAAAVRGRRMVESAGLRYVGAPYIADAARALTQDERHA